MCRRQVYHTQRMQRVFAARFSGDGAYVFSGSDDMNVRVWKVRPFPTCSCCLPCCLPNLKHNICALFELCQSSPTACCALQQLKLHARRGCCAGNIAEGRAAAAPKAGGSSAGARV